MKTLPAPLVIWGLFLLTILSPLRAAALTVEDQNIISLQTRVDSLEQRIQRLPVRTEDGAVAFLFGAFCALWAQNTRRNSWLWFFLGLFFSVITVLFLLAKNAGDRRPPA